MVDIFGADNHGIAGVQERGQFGVGFAAIAFRLHHEPFRAIVPQPGQHGVGVGMDLGGIRIGVHVGRRDNSDFNHA